MPPAFPTQTFPNHYTIATGPYREHHGIVGNTMHDPETSAWFRLSDPETDAAIARVDRAVGALVAGIEVRGLTERVNLVVASDHGMTAAPQGQVIYLDDYVDLEELTIVEWSPVVMIDPGAGRVDEVYRRLRRAHPHLTVNRKDDIPARYHYRDHPRIPPIVVLADEGWTIGSRRGNRGLPPSERGTHGYDPAIRSMRALFVAAGPAFARGVTVQPFGNVHLYALMCHVLELRPAPNDGALDSVRAVLKAPPERSDGSAAVGGGGSVTETPPELSPSGVLSRRAVAAFPSGAP